MKKPRKPEVVEVRFRILTAETNAMIRLNFYSWAQSAAMCLNGKLVRKPTVERVGKR